MTGDTSHYYWVLGIEWWHIWYCQLRHSKMRIELGFTVVITCKIRLTVPPGEVCGCLSSVSGEAQLPVPLLHFLHENALV